MKKYNFTIFVIMVLVLGISTGIVSTIIVTNNHHFITDEQLETYKHYEKIVSCAYQLHQDMDIMIDESYMYDDVNASRLNFFDCDAGEDYAYYYYRMDSLFHNNPNKDSIINKFHNID